MVVVGAAVVVVGAAVVVVGAAVVVVGAAVVVVGAAVVVVTTHSSLRSFIAYLRLALTGIFLVTFLPLTMTVLDLQMCSLFTKRLPCLSMRTRFHKKTMCVPRCITVIVWHEVAAPAEAGAATLPIKVNEPNTIASPAKNTLILGINLFNISNLFHFCDAYEILYNGCHRIQCLVSKHFGVSIKPRKSLPAEVSGVTFAYINYLIPYLI